MEITIRRGRLWSNHAIVRHEGGVRTPVVGILVLDGLHHHRKSFGEVSLKRKIQILRVQLLTRHLAFTHYV